MQTLLKLFFMTVLLAAAPTTTAQPTTNDKSLPGIVTEWVKDALKLSADKDVEIKLLYDATKDGWNAADFHAACDNKGATVTLAKSANGPDYFGGFADVSWTSSNAFARSTRSFLFTLGEHTRNRATFNNLRINIPRGEEEMQKHALYHGGNVGPCFGSFTSWRDLCFADRANEDKTSSCQQSTAPACNQDNPTSSYDVDLMFGDVGSGGMLSGASD